MIARTVESQGNYWLASGEAYGRPILAEGIDRPEAIKNWVSAAAERQAEVMAVESGQRAFNRVMGFINS